jgi:hypothetical protein
MMLHFKVWELRGVRYLCEGEGFILTTIKRLP